MPKTQAFTISANRPIARGIFKMYLNGDTAGFAPGRFVNLAVPGFYLRRPLAICDYGPKGFSVVYRVVGGGTQALSALPAGTAVDILAPLGNGFSLREDARVLLVGGGMGVAPLLSLAKHLEIRACHIQVVCGFGSADEVYLYSEFKSLTPHTAIATLDGSFGTKGLVTDAIPSQPYDYFYACGPEAMLQALEKTLACDGEVSVEERMACGFGGCMGCAIQTTGGVKRVCKDGPVFKKGEIVW